MDITQLKYFITVARTLNFSEAARRMGVTQPLISHHVNELEKQLGGKLFTRSRHNVTLTEAGERWTLATADSATAHVATDDFACDDWLFSQAHVEDAAGTWVLDSGWSYDCAREGYELVAVGSSVSTPAEFAASSVRLSGQGALAVYKKL